MTDPGTDPPKLKENEIETRDIALPVTPAQAMELHRLGSYTESIKMGYALLAMKQLNETFADDEHKLDEVVDINLAVEEEKLREAVNSYKSFLDDCGVKNGTKDFERAMAIVGLPISGDMKNFKPPDGDLSNLENPLLEEIPPKKSVFFDEALPAPIHQKIILIDREPVIFVAETQLQEPEPAQSNEPEPVIQVLKLIEVRKNIQAPSSECKKSAIKKTSARPSQPLQRAKPKQIIEDKPVVSLHTWNFEPIIPTNSWTARATDKMPQRPLDTISPYNAMNLQSLPVIQKQALRMAIARRMAQAPSVVGGNYMSATASWANSKSEQRLSRNHLRTDLPSIYPISIKSHATSQRVKFEAERDSEKEKKRTSRAQTPGVKFPEIKQNSSSNLSRQGTSGSKNFINTLPPIEFQRKKSSFVDTNVDKEKHNK
ncbi:hypothetical protein HK096_007360 [Nowakowskiella sp. JEL0078]|nr:hypothetical protein HK096_007360 [Nowakowskiella sp. JEL0078]